MMERTSRFFALQCRRNHQLSDRDQISQLNELRIRAIRLRHVWLFGAHNA